MTEVIIWVVGVIFEAIYELAKSVQMCRHAEDLTALQVTLLGYLIKELVSWFTIVLCVVLLH